MNQGSSTSRLLRGLDIAFSMIGLVGLSPFFLIITAMGLLETGSPFFHQIRVGRYRQPFTLVKFRTMRLDTPSVATHLADAATITRLGRILRRTKLDELPQLWNVIKGEMSLVGPRPCLPQQVELINARAARRVFDQRPGITGLAQVHGMDMSDAQKLAEWDARMLASFSLAAYFRYIAQTVIGAGRGDRIDSGGNQ